VASTPNLSNTSKRDLIADSGSVYPTRRDAKFTFRFIGAIYCLPGSGFTCWGRIRAQRRNSARLKKHYVCIELKQGCLEIYKGPVFFCRRIVFKTV
jgi:hypothetical protein